jgi:hypothetical protein
MVKCFFGKELLANCFNFRLGQQLPLAQLPLVTNRSHAISYIIKGVLECLFNCRGALALI